MDIKKATTSIIAIATAAAIALGVTFAWQNYNQANIDEAKNAVNPGGRLHDDFSGYNTASVIGTTKDVYVEHFGSEGDPDIYARVRLDEYMEIGAGAGEADGTEGKTATPLVSTASIGDPATWTTHIPSAGDVAAANDETADPFHDYWTWAMGGSTVYMPTFNKNQDSLSADVNGTMDGTDPDDDIYYDDFVAYAAGDAVTATAYYDADDNTDDEYTGAEGEVPGGGGTEATDSTPGNYTSATETHAAAETIDGTVITMAEYNALSDEEKTALNAWVYDTDGWAYWSRPIQPGTATGLLLDGLTLSNAPGQAWYYAINAVAQFITYDDLGRADGTGFYDTAAGSVPTDDALALLSFIGVDTVDRTVTVTLSDGADVTLAAATEITAGESAAFSARATRADGTGVDDAIYTWTAGDENGDAIEGVSLAAETSAMSAAAAVTGQTVTLYVDSAVAADTQITVKCVVSVDGSEAGSQTHLVTVTAAPVYVLTLTADGDATTVKKGETLNFTSSLTRDGAAFSGNVTYTWSVSGGSSPDTKIEGGVLTVNSGETAGTVLTVTAAATVDGKVVATAERKVTVSQTEVIVTVTAANNADTIRTAGTLQYTAAVTADGAAVSPSVTWSVTDSDGNEVDGAGVDANGLLSVKASVADGTVLTVKAETTVDGVTANDTTTVTVKAATFVVTVTANGNATTVKRGETLTFTSSLTRDGAAFSGNVTYAWSVSGNKSSNTKMSGSVLTVGSDETGGITLTVTATATVDGKVVAAGTKQVTVHQTVVAVTVTAADSAATITTGNTLQYTAAVTADGAAVSSPTVTWSVTNSSGKAVTGAGISSAGLLSVDANVADGTVLTVKATTTVDGVTASNTATVTVKAAVYAVTVTAANSATTITQGSTLTFTASATKDGAAVSGAAFTWSATAGTMSGSTLSVTTSVAVGTTVTVTAKTTLDGKEVSGSAGVTVKTTFPVTTSTAVGTNVTIDNTVFIVAAVDAANSRALLVQKALESSTMAYGSSNETYWDGSLINTYLNNTWLSGKATLKDKAVSVEHKTRIGSTAYQTSYEKVFLLSGGDVGMGGCTDYTYGSSALSCFDTENECIAYRNNTADEWWLRSKTSSYSSGYKVIATDGDWSSATATSAYAVRPVLWVSI